MIWRPLRSLRMRRYSRIALYSCALALITLAASGVLAESKAAKKAAAHPLPGVGSHGFHPHEVSHLHAVISKHPTHAKPGTAHGKFVVKKAIKHVPIPHEHFRKLADKAGNVKLPNGKTVKVGDWHAAVHHIE